MAHRSATPCQPASNLHPLSRSFLHPERLSPASRPVTRVPRNTRPGPDGPEVGQSRSQGRGPGGCQGSRATGAPARPSQLEEGVQAGMRKLRVPRPGGKPRNLSMRLSQEDPQPKLIPVPARFPGPGISAAPPPRSPHPGSPSRRQRGFASRSQQSQSWSPHPRGPGGGRSGPALGGGTAPGLTSSGFSLVLSRPRRPRPALQSCVQPGRWGRPRLCGTALPSPCIGAAPSAGLSVCPAPSVRAGPLLPVGARLCAPSSARAPAPPGPLRPPIPPGTLAGRASAAGTWLCPLPGPAENHIGPA